MTTATLFADGESQAVRLPDDMRFEGVAEVDIERQGESLVLTPRKPQPSAAATPQPTLSIVDAIAAAARKAGITDEDVDAIERVIAANKRRPEPIMFE